MQKVARRRRGFTLIETVVTVGIIATLAAVVVPQVVNQFDAADPTRLQNDLKGLQSAIETFNVNTKAYPGDLDDLANAITTADTALGIATTLSVYLSPSQTSYWNGPYVDFSLTDIVDASGEATKTTGFGATILDTFVCYNSLDNTHGTSDAIQNGALNDAACPANAGQKFLAIQITGLAAAATDASFLSLNTLFDGGSEATPATMGRVRFEVDAGTGTVDVAYFLVIPIG